MLDMLRRFFSCSYHEVVTAEGSAFMGIAKCALRMAHRGPHRFPYGLVPSYSRGTDHPHDGYAYDGCACVCCLNVRALAAR